MDVTNLIHFHIDALLIVTSNIVIATTFTAEVVTKGIAQESLRR